MKRQNERTQESLKLGQEIHGFSLTKCQKISEIDGVGYLFSHKKTGARLAWLACEDTNRSFSIAFKTPPSDDTGVFHILEHSVLCGSDRFPVKEPFVNLLKSSMQTFLNAFTFPDKTMYPVASTNVADLKNLMDVYLDAVLHPAIYKKPRTLEQEGWHLEYDKDSDTLRYNGVVMSEMKGVMSDPDSVLTLELCRDLFPKTAYRFESGGDPKHIAELSYEQFCDQHKRHYCLSNSYTMLYGKLDIDEMLEFIAQRFENACPPSSKDPNPLEVQEPVAAAPRQVSMSCKPDNARLAWAWALEAEPSYTKVFALGILLEALLGSNEAPLKRLLLQKTGAHDVNPTLISELEQPVFGITLKGIKNGQAEKLSAYVREACEDLVKNGIDKKRLSSALAQEEFHLREGDFESYPEGIAHAVTMLSSWLYNDDRPFDFLLWEDALKTLKEGLKGNYFEQLLDECVLKNTHKACVELVPTDEPSDAEEKALLAKLCQNMSEEQKQGIAQEAELLREEQAREDSPEALASLPSLELDQLSSYEDAYTEKLVPAPLPCFYQDIPSKHIAYFRSYTDLSHLETADLVYLPLFCSLLTKLKTSVHSASELDTEIDEKLGTLSFSASVMSLSDDELRKAQTRLGKDSAPTSDATSDMTGAAGLSVKSAPANSAGLSAESAPTKNVASPEELCDWRLLFVASSSALSSQTKAMSQLLCEVLFETDFSDKERIKAICQQKRTAMEEAFLMSGHLAAMQRLSTQFSEAGLLSDLLSGVEQYRFICKILDNFDKNFDELAAKLQKLPEKIFCTDRFETSFCGSQQDFENFWNEAGDLGFSRYAKAPLGTLKPLSSLLPRKGSIKLSAPQVCKEAFSMPSKVCYVAYGCKDANTKELSLGAARTAAKLLSLDYLWNEVRVKAGAYGCGLQYTNDRYLSYFSYRDPALDSTLSAYRGAAQWLKAFRPSERDFKGYLISLLANLDAPLKVRGLSKRGDSLRLSLRGQDWIQELRKEVLATTLDDLRVFAQKLEDPQQNWGVCVFGSSEIIEAAHTNFDKVHKLLG